MPALPPLIAVVGPVKPALLTAWATHYRALGIERFHLAFHFPDHVDPDRRHQVQAACRELGIVPAAVSVGPWHEHTNPRLRDALRERADAGWHLLADSDELHSYPAPLDEVIAAADESGTGTVGGLMLDRVTADGSLTDWDAEQGLDAAYPLGAFLTHRLLRGDPRKVVLAHSDVRVASGNHRAEGHGRVVAIEPSPAFHKALTANLTANGCANVRTINAAVSDHPGRLTFYLERATNLGGTTAVRPRTVEASFEADAAPLPTLLTAEEIATARLVKIDVEGGEAAAVRGLAPVLSSLRDDVELVIEVTPKTLAKEGHTVDDVLGPLNAHGFHVYRLVNDYGAGSYPAALRRPVPPVRWHGPVTEMSDLVFSRRDVETLR
ncbi:FkbM family methyltransferase [Streptomyces mirabilis]|uniref:FkbM family methyltransferase n=1 Tax=Streptomyces mirabilis TaxID=68239 RepID=UPI0033D95799